MKYIRYGIMMKAMHCLALIAIVVNIIVDSASRAAWICALIWLMDSIIKSFMLGMMNDGCTSNDESNSTKNDIKENA